MAIVAIVTLLASIIILSKSASITVSSASKIANYFKISSLAVGFILISFSTTLPELSVSIISSMSGDGAIAAGNAFGSVITDIFFILGLGAFLYGFKISKENSKEVDLILLITVILSVYIIFITSVRKNALGVFEGAILIFSYIIYLFYVLKSNKRNNEEEQYVQKPQAINSILYFLASIILVLISSSFVVSSSIELAELFNLSEGFIGATIIAIGTSLPEASICLQAIRKKQYGIALGNATGASVANLTFVIGVAAIINPIYLVMPVFITALLFAILAAVFLLYITAVNKKMGRFGGAIFLFIYLLYLASMFYFQFS